MRETFRPDAFVLAGSGYKRGELLKSPLRFHGQMLPLHHSTGASGSVRVGVQRPSREPFPELALSDMPEQCGDKIAELYES